VVIPLWERPSSPLGRAGAVATGYDASWRDRQQHLRSLRFLWPEATAGNRPKRLVKDVGELVGLKWRSGGHRRRLHRPHSPMADSEKTEIDVAGGCRVKASRA
jgi:hypothetical protein